MSSRDYSVITVHLQPSARLEQICGWTADGCLKIKIREKPIEGKANQTLRRFLSKALDYRMNDIEISSGKKSRRKILKIYGIEQNDLVQRINEIVDHEP